MSEAILIEAENGDMITVTVEQATAITEAIRSATQGLYLLIQRAHSHKIYTVLGYTTWEEYVNKEFNISRGRSYQLLNQAKVIEEISEAAGTPVYLTEREARAIKDALPEITQQIAEDTEGCSPEEKRFVVDEAVKEELRKKGDAEALQDDIGEPEEDNAVYSGGGRRREGEDYPPTITPRNSARYTQTEIEFFVESLEKTIPIFTALPEPEELIKTIKSKSNSEDLVSSIRTVAKWFAMLANNID
jgi:hypothetical protein